MERDLYPCLSLSLALFLSLYKSAPVDESIHEGRGSGVKLCQSFAAQSTLYCNISYVIIVWKVIKKMLFFYSDLVQMLSSFHSKEETCEGFECLGPKLGIIYIYF